MAESVEHINFVIMIGEYVKGLLPENEHPFIFTDTPDNVAATPSVVGDFRPDVYYRNNGRLVIGEAKTDSDFDRQHSICQYMSYFAECDGFAGESLLVLGGSWRISASFANLMRNLKRQFGYKTKAVVISDTGRPKVIE